MTIYGLKRVTCISCRSFAPGPGELGECHRGPPAITATFPEAVDKTTGAIQQLPGRPRTSAFAPVVPLKTCCDEYQRQSRWNSYWRFLTGRNP